MEINMKKVKVKRIIPIFKKKRIRNNKVEGKTITQINREKKMLDLSLKLKKVMREVMRANKDILAMSTHATREVSNKNFPYNLYGFTLVRGKKWG